MTSIYGLDIFGVDLKKAAKMFANRFACGSSVAKNNQGQDEIVVQGDFSDELYQLILSNWPNVNTSILHNYTMANIMLRYLKKILTRLKKKRKRRANHKEIFIF